MGLSVVLRRKFTEADEENCSGSSFRLSATLTAVRRY